MVARTKVVISGLMGTGGEVWSTGVYYGGDPEFIMGASAIQQYAQDIADNIGDMIEGTTLSSALSVSGSVTRIDTYQYETIGPAIAVGTAAVEGVVGGTSVAHPFQVAQVISSRAALSGARYRGRNYWPAVGTPVNVQGLFSAPGAGAGIHEVWLEMIEAIADLAAAPGSFLWSIYSPTFNLLTPVTQASWDTVPDIQRRRADALVGLRYTVDAT